MRESRRPGAEASEDVTDQSVSSAQNSVIKVTFVLEGIAVVMFLISQVIRFI